MTNNDEKLIKCVWSFVDAITEAGGKADIDMLNWKLKDVIALIAPNNIEFVYKGNLDESSRRRNGSTSTVTK